MSQEQIAAVLGEVWDDGNCTGLDGWIGPGRGAGEVDDHAVHARDRAIEKYAGMLMSSDEAIERAAKESWDAIIDGAAPWDDLDEFTKDLHMQTTRAVAAALGGAK